MFLSAVTRRLTGNCSKRFSPILPVWTRSIFKRRSISECSVKTLRNSYGNGSLKSVTRRPKFGKSRRRRRRRKCDSAWKRKNLLSRAAFERSRSRLCSATAAAMTAWWTWKPCGNTWNRLAAELTFHARRNRRGNIGFPRLFARRDVVFGFGAIPFALVVPKCPKMAPLVPTDAEMLHVNVVLSEHLADLPASHTRHGVAVDDDFFTFRQGPESADNSFDIIICRRIRIGIGGDINRAGNMFLFVFFGAA